PELRALLEEELEAEAEPDEPRPRAERGVEGVLKARGREALLRRSERPDARQHDAPRRGDALRIARQVDVRAQARERAPHRRHVADAVVEKRDLHAVSVPFVERTAALVSATASLRARAADLKTASAA